MRWLFPIIILTLAIVPLSIADEGGYYADDMVSPVGTDGRGSPQLLTEFNETVTARRIVDVYSNPSWGVSIRRDDVRTVGSGYVDTADGEIRVGVTAAAGDESLVESVDRASYIPGNQGQVGIGIRVPVLPVNDQVARWGLFSDENGFGWGIDATGPFIFYRTDSVDTITRPSAFSVDPLDGTGKSRINLDLTDGHIFEIDFVWYGYGSISWRVLASPDGIAAQNGKVAHVFNPAGTLSIEDPNQPIRVEVENGAAGGAFDVRIGGRQFSLYRGTNRIQVRDLHEIVYSVALAANPTWTPLICVRRKATVNGRVNSIRAHMLGSSVLSGSDVELRTSFADTVTGGAWGAPTGVSASETGMETNTTMSSVTVGEITHRTLLAASIGVARGVARERERDDFPRDEPACLWARPFAGTPTIDAAIFNWEEGW